MVPTNNSNYKDLKIIFKLINVRGHNKSEKGEEGGDHATCSLRAGREIEEKTPLGLIILYKCGEIKKNKRRNERSNKEGITVKITDLRNKERIKNKYEKERIKNKYEKERIKKQSRKER